MVPKLFVRGFKNVFPLVLKTVPFSFAREASLKKGKVPIVVRFFCLVRVF